MKKPNSIQVKKQTLIWTRFGGTKPGLFPVTTWTADIDLKYAEKMHRWLSRVIYWQKAWKNNK